MYLATGKEISYISRMTVRNVKTQTISLLSPGDEPILAGRLDGKRAFLRVLEALPAVTEPTVIILDFIRAELVTSSFLSEVALPLRDHLRFRHPPAYLVLANLNDRIVEELNELLNRVGDAILVCKLSSRGAVSNARLVGRLEPKLQETFDLISEKRETTAIELHAASSDSAVGATAWNNRLNALTSKSLVMEIPQGRTKKYRAVLEIA